MIDLIKENAALIITSLFGGGSFYGWIMERRKRNAEAGITEEDLRSKSLDNQEKENNIYKEMLDDLGGRYEKRFVEVTSLYDSKIKQLEEEIKYHKQVINNLKKEIIELKKKIKELEK